MANATEMRYGSYQFIPVPLMNLTKEFVKTDDGGIIGTVFVVSLEGTLTPLPGDTVGGLLAVDTLQDALRTAFSSDGKLFEVKCLPSSTILQAYPRIRSINFEQSSNNWVFSTPFTIELEFDDEIDLDENSSLYPPYIESASESWTVEFVDENLRFAIDLNSVTDQQVGNYYGVDENPFQVRITHNINAKGKSHYSGPGLVGTLDRVAWQEAREFVIGKLGLETEHISSSGVLNLTGASFAAFNHIRQTETNELGGEFSVTETWISVSGSGSEEATEDFSINVRSGISDGITSVSIEGTVQGLETRVYGNDPGDYQVTTTAFAAAETYYASVQSRILSRAQYAGESTATRNFNPFPVSQSVGQSPSRGQITYAFEYNDRPCAFITGALSENITITDNNPADVFARLAVLGRSRGPVLQNISTVTEATREITIEAVMEPFTNCASISDLDLNKPTTNVKNLLCSFQEDIVATYEQIFKESDTENWNPMTGRYTRSVSYVFGNCTGSAPVTSLCL